jgi:hypothetical protein
MEKHPSQPPTEVEAQHGSGSSTVSEPIAIRIVDAPPTSDDQKQYEQNSYRLQRKSFVVGVITLLILVGYTGINLLLYLSTHEQLQLSERAWLSVETDAIKDFGQGKEPTWTFRLHNIGHLPAQHVSHTSQVWRLPYPIPENLTLPVDLDWKKDGMVFPNAPFVFATHINMTSSDYEQVAGGKIGVAVWGRVKYSDGITSTTRYTPYCFILTANPNYIGFAEGTLTEDCSNHAARQDEPP